MSLNVSKDEVVDFILSFNGTTRKISESLKRARSTLTAYYMQYCGIEEGKPDILKCDELGDGIDKIDHAMSYIEKIEDNVYNSIGRIKMR